jgi:hypothetical protein
MIHFLQFEQQEQGSWGPGQQLAYELASRNRPPLPTVTQLTRIFAAFMGALFIAVCFLFSHNDTLTSVVAAHPLLMFAQQVFFAGVLFALAVVLLTGIPLAGVVWRSTPSARFLLILPFLAVVAPLLLFLFMVLHFFGHVIAVGSFLLAFILLAAAIWRATPRMRIRLIILFLAVVPLLLINIAHPRPGVGIFIAVGSFLFASTLLAAAVWRAIPRMRILSTILFLVFGLGFLSFILALLLPLLLPDFVGPLGHMAGFVLGYNLPIIGNLGNVIVCLIIYGFPILTTIAINQAIRQAALPEKWLRFARLPGRFVAFALLVMFLALLSWGGYLALFAPAVLFSLSFPLLPAHPWLIAVIGLLICVVISARAFSSQPHRAA